MSTLNDENKRKVEQKYQKFKSMQLQGLSPSPTASPCDKVLQSLDQNTVQKCPHNQPPSFPDSFHNLLKSVPRTPKILQIMLSDPNIYQFSQSLKKQAQQKNMQILISSFPQRYRSLLQIQGKYEVLQKQSKQKIEKSTKEIQILMEKLWRVQGRCKQQEQMLEDMRGQMREFDERNKDQYCEIFRKKEQQIMDLKQKLQNVQKKLTKLKQDYKNSNTVILQLRQQEQQTQKQTQRLISKLTTLQQKLTSAHKKILQHNTTKQLELSTLQTQHKSQLNQLHTRIQHLQQLLQQANIRIQYKESLINLAEEECERNLGKMEEELGNKGRELMELREMYLGALRSIDQLEESMGENQERKTREWGVWCVEREELKKQLDKYHQWNAQLKAELDVKNQLLKMQQKSIQCLKQNFESQLLKKTNEHIQLSSNLQQAQCHQHNLTKQLHIQQQKLSQLETHLQQLSHKNKQLVQLINEQTKINVQNQKQNKANRKEEEETLRKYLDIIVDQEEVLGELRIKVEKWMMGAGQRQEGYGKGDQYGNRDQCGDNNRGIRDWWYQQKMASMKNKIEEYERVIQKMKKQIISLSNNSKQSSQKGAKILKDLIQQNKILNKQLSAQPSTRINLFA